MVIRNQIISEARKWIGTPFHSQSSKINVGCDCVGLLVGIASNLEVKSIQGKDLSAYIPRHYDYFQDRYYFLEQINKQLIKGVKTDGAIAVVGHKDIGWHAGIISRHESGVDTWIHSCMRQGKVVEQRFIEHLFDTVQYFEFVLNNKKG